MICLTTPLITQHLQITSTAPIRSPNRNVNEYLEDIRTIYSLLNAFYVFYLWQSVSRLVVSMNSSVASYRQYQGDSLILYHVKQHDIVWGWNIRLF